jgi:integrase
VAGLGVSRGRRAVRLGEETVAALRAWKAQQDADRERLGEAWEDGEGHVFTHAVLFTKPVRYGVPVRPDCVTRAFRRIASGAELPPLRLHGLRHSWATTAHLNGVGLQVIADQLGHADVSVTDRTYTATLLSVQEHAATLVEQSIKTTRGGGSDGGGTESGQRATLREVS